MSDDIRTSKPSPKAGQEDDEKKQTDEEKIQEKIDQQRAKIGALPNNTSNDVLNRAPHQKKLGQLEFQYQNLVEKKRLARELSKFEEMHGAIYSEPCLICLDNIHVRASEELYQLFFCCGGFVCESCAGDTQKSEIGIDKCPLCRESLHETSLAESAAQLMALAKRGVAWAQHNAGKGMFDGRNGFKKQEKAGLKWINKAAAQQYPSALYDLSDFYRDGLQSAIGKSQEKANELLLKAANLGHGVSNSTLAKFYFDGMNGFDKDPAEGFFRASFAFALDGSASNALFVGMYHHRELIPEPSPYLACYYLNIVTANENVGGVACYFYTQALLELAGSLYNGRFQTPGSNVVPAMFFWLRKSCDLGDSDALEQLKKWETREQSLCAHCFKKAQAQVNFKQCSNCNSQWYCSKECQVEAWKAGHKKDCKRSKLNFEDYLNAD